MGRGSVFGPGKRTVGSPSQVWGGGSVFPTLLLGGPEEGGCGGEEKEVIQEEQ